MGEIAIINKKIKEAYIAQQTLKEERVRYTLFEYNIKMKFINDIILGLKIERKRLILKKMRLIR